MDEGAGVAISKAIEAALISPNVPDDNDEAANVVDVINRLAVAMERLAVAIEARSNA